MCERKSQRYKENVAHYVLIFAVIKETFVPLTVAEEVKIRYARTRWGTLLIIANSIC